MTMIQQEPLPVSLHDATKYISSKIVLTLHTPMVLVTVSTTSAMATPGTVQGRSDASQPSKPQRPESRIALVQT